MTRLKSGALASSFSAIMVMRESHWQVELLPGCTGHSWFIPLGWSLDWGRLNWRSYRTLGVASEPLLLGRVWMKEMKSNETDISRNIPSQLLDQHSKMEITQVSGFTKVLGKSQSTKVLGISRSTKVPGFIKVPGPFSGPGSPSCSSTPKLY